jgi:hypothetical protein
MNFTKRKNIFRYKNQLEKINRLTNLNEMKTTALIIIMTLNFTVNIIVAQEKVINTRFNGGELGLTEYLIQNLLYPVLSQENKSTGYSITGITITPEGEIFDISTINKIDDSIEKNIYKVLQNTKNRWLKSDTISKNQTFYIQIIYLYENSNDSPVFKLVNDKYNFLEPVVLTALGWGKTKLPETKESITTKMEEKLKKEEYSDALNYINELIRRNPFSKELYQKKMSINTTLNDEHLRIEDEQKIHNFIPGVSLDELINKN